MNSTRPSGAVIIRDCVVKVVPQDGGILYDRHQQPLAATTLVCSGLLCSDLLVFKRYDTVPDSFPLTAAVMFAFMEPFWRNSSQRGFQRCDLSSYVAYALRASNLPPSFRSQVLSTVPREPYQSLGNCAQVHGDLTRDNVMWDPDTESLVLIDLSTRPELPFMEADRAKFYFHDYVHGIAPLPELTPLEWFFVATHFCRVWTRDTSLRPTLEAKHAEWTTTPRI